MKKCSKCGEWKEETEFYFRKSGYYSWCKICENRYSEQYHKDNKEKEKKYRQNNKKQFNKYRKQWETENKKHRTEYMEKYRENNKNYRAQYQKNYRQTLSGKACMVADNHNRRTLTKELAKETIRRVYEANILKFGTLTCCLCFIPIVFGDDSLDHLIPISRGGGNEYENLGIAHRDCNSRKFKMTLSEWFEKYPKKRRVSDEFKAETFGSE